ncbi:MAG: amino acid adenylation domain-containing protein, partial [bacterium]|nr:amino acid adenylation domain-containing protein [bacterium]
MPPRDPTEELLAGIWEEVLARDAGVGVYDNFFTLGGHSLLATRVVSRIRTTLGVELSLMRFFETPTIAGLAARLRELMRGGERPAPSIVPVPRTGELPLSFAQERLWFLDRLQPGSPWYNVPAILHLKGPLDRRALARALNEIVRRHEVLRTRYPAVDGVPVQVIEPVFEPPLALVDLERLPAPRRRAAAGELALDEARRPFAPDRGPILRVQLLRLAGTPDREEHQLLLTMHHIACDDWSLGIFLRELAALYQAGGSDRPVPSLPEPAVQYADFAVWQREWLAADRRSGVLATQLAYWRERLAGLPVLELPCDRPRPAVLSSRGAVERFAIPVELHRRLQELSRHHGATMFMTLLAAFQALLERYTGQQDLAVGTVIANRNRTEIESLLGFFVNTLVLRVDLSGEPDSGAPTRRAPTFRQLSARVREAALGAYVHQDLPFEKLVEELVPERSLSRNPLFQVLLVLQHAPAGSWELEPGLTMEIECLDTGTAKFDLDLFLEEEDQGALVGWFAYNTDLFDRTTIRRLARHFHTVLETVAADPERRLAQLPLMSAAERHQLLWEWSHTHRLDIGAARCLHELFEAQAARTPDAVAVVAGAECLSYGQLNRRAQRLACALRARGDARPEVPVGVCLKRSPATIAALLAVLKAGGVFLYLDPDHPRERLAFMLRDAGVTAVISRRRLRGRLPAEMPILWADAGAGADRRPGALPSGVDPDNAAYVIYTSGSTGLPKGVTVSHGVIAAHCEMLVRHFSLTPADCTLQVGSFNFDIALEQVLPILISGGRVVLAPEDLWLPSELVDRFRELAVTVADMPTGYWRQWVEEASAGDKPPEKPLSQLRVVFVGGEEMTADAACRWQRTPMAAAALVNGYGPTEATVTAMQFRVPAGPPAAELCRLRAPIGGPLPGRTLSILDRHAMPVAIGVTGELCLGGPLLARGYLERPALSAERFVPDPRGDAGARLYRTGDLARMRPDGNVDFLGRLDDQVKIRGFRIELGEIAAALAEHAAVREQLVTARDHGRGDRQLVAYLVCEPRPAARELREFLHQRLPSYMVPAVFAFLDALPRLPSGKVDRAALKRRTLPEGLVSEEQFVPPRDPTEELLAAIWEDVLGLGGRIGVHENFFTLGGHSLLATRVVSQIRTALGVELSLRRLFEAPTVAGLAAQLGELMRGGGARPAPAIARVPRTGDLPLSFAQERLWFLDRYEPDSPLYNIPVAYRLTGGLSPAALDASLRAVVRRHESLRTTFTDGPRQHIAAELAVALTLVDLRRLPAAQRPAVAAALAAAEAERPFDLAAGPLLRSALLRLDDDEHRLLLTLHHIIADGWSIEVLAGELAAFYQHPAAGDRPAGLSDPPIQYADFACWQRQWLTGAVLEEQLAYWRETLAGAATALELPADRPRPPVASHRGAALSRPLPSALGEPLKSLGRRQGTTLFMTLLAAFFALLHRYTGQRDLLVGTPVANRGRRQIEGLIGLFLNTLVLRGDLAGEPGTDGPTYRELLCRVRAAALGAYTHQDVPFERLVEELEPERDLSRSPLFQVMFAVHRAGDWELAPGVPMREVSVESRDAKFDMTFFVIEKGSEPVAGVRYSTDLFDQVTIERLLAHFERLLAGVAAAPEQRVSELALLGRAEEHALLAEWNDTAIREGEEGCVHELFATQAARRPAAVAVTQGERVLTYGELGRRAAELAGELRRRDVGPEQVVALFVERSPEMLVGMLGILAAGGAYLPLDPGYPASRLSYMVADAGTRVILTQESLRDRLEDALPEPAPVVMALDSVEVAGACRGNLGNGKGKGIGNGNGNGIGNGRGKGIGNGNGATTENLAYVIYTSGSTGRPKGVEIRHSGLTNLVRWHQRTYRVTAADRATQVAGLSFDASVREIWPYMTAGASLHLPDDETRISPPRLVSWLARKSITLSFQPTPLAEALLAEPWPAGTGLRALLTGGDRLHKRPGSSFPAALRNHYGPTENTVVTSAGTVQPQAPRLPTIGRPIANTAVYVVDRKQRPVPIGVAGELVARGVGLARGYSRRPALSAERFVPDPWSQTAGARLYRTGDLVRWRPDGRIDFLGRIDHQVKIRGFRIELGEIEEGLGEHPAVAEAVVIPREERLVAWMVPASDAEFAVAELRRFLAERLPDYMVPGIFSSLAELPLLPSGKVDRAALGRLPLPEGPWPGETRVAPRSPVEEVLAGIWAELLDLDPGRIGVHDNFFELGGHSLVVTQLASRIRDLLGVEIELRSIF